MKATGNYIVKWNDQNGHSKKKIYTSSIEARKAYDWLVKNGADAVDLAIEVREVEAVDE